jgi:GT2 family glycosyltransferase
MSVLIATMNVNLPHLTDNLIQQVTKDKSVDFEVMVLENGATEKSSYSTHSTDKNYFFGGGLNLIFDYYLNSTNHDWLMVLNNDLIVHGEKFLSTMLSEAEENDVCQLSPVVINMSIEQCFWKQMHNWMTGGTRLVDWIDFQAPLLRRDICELIGQYPMELIYGWGNDFLTGIIARENNLKVGVTDKVCIGHLNSQTLNKGVTDLDGEPLSVAEYCQRAEAGMNQYMQMSNRWDIFNTFKHNAATYTYK